jgi:hypothetical protein
LLCNPGVACSECGRSDISLLYASSHVVNADAATVSEHSDSSDGDTGVCGGEEVDGGSDQAGEERDSGGGEGEKGGDCGGGGGAGRGCGVGGSESLRFGLSVDETMCFVFVTGVLRALA